MTLQEMLVQNANELHLKIEEHRRLLTQVEETGLETEELRRCPLFACPNAKLLKETIIETISVIDDTRKSFRSKQLEVLRKKLIGVLAENA